ncbi:fic family toxin-antitoxin system, toxin component [Streptomyces sp. NPDC102395]|uniref:fic family toxin-antitoxin system, toxin component n=1 Tax=Streptomyces sp. NPDC102395 TaxID=3366168 RepID=UPI00382241D9
MDLHIDVPWILQVAEAAGADDPAPDDYGVPVSAVARHRAELFEHPVYDGPYARAAALVHTLGRCRWLERSNMAVAAASGVIQAMEEGNAQQHTTTVPHDPAAGDMGIERDWLIRVASAYRSSDCIKDFIAHAEPLEAVRA